MATPRVGALGVGTTKGDLYVLDTDGDLERLPVGADGQVLVADSTDPLGVKWAANIALVPMSFMADAVDAVFKTVNLGAGNIANPTTVTVGSQSALSFAAGVLRGIPWQKYMPLTYTAGNGILVKIYWAAQTAIVGDVIWAAAFERDSSVTPDNVLTDNFAALQTAPASTAPGVVGQLALATVTFTSAQIDGILSGEPCRLFIQRTGTDAGDTMLGAARILRVVVEEV